MRFHREVLPRFLLALLTITALAHPAPAEDLFTSAITIPIFGSDKAGKNDIRKVDQLFRGESFAVRFPGYRAVLGGTGTYAERGQGRASGEERNGERW